MSDVRFDRPMSHEIGRLDGPTREALVVLGAVLRELRGERGLSQRALADRCGLSQATISRLESGKAEGVRVAWIARLLAGLDAQVRGYSDDRPMLERCHGFRKLRTAFDPTHGKARWWAREVERRRGLELLIRDRDLGP
jgi:transcriptional regulator with XRE-family HTH domain